MVQITKIKQTIHATRKVNELPPDGSEKRRAHGHTGASTTSTPPTHARRDAHRRARTHARTHTTGAQYMCRPTTRVRLRLTALVTISAEAKEIYRPKQSAAGTEAVYRLDQSDLISCTASVKPLGSLGANSTICVWAGCVWVGVRVMKRWPVAPRAMPYMHARAPMRMRVHSCVWMGNGAISGATCG